jgi:hypothetical protein
MTSFINKIKLQHRLLLPNLFYVVLFVSILLFFLNSKSLIATLSNEQTALSALTQDVRETSFDIKDYIYNELSFEDLEKKYESFISGIDTPSMKAEFEALWKDVVSIHETQKKK